MANDVQTWLKDHLDRIQNGVDKVRERQEEAAVHTARIEERLEASNRRFADLHQGQGALVKKVNGLTVAHAKTGGLAGLLSGGIAGLIVKVLELLFGGTPVG